MKIVLVTLALTSFMVVTGLFAEEVSEEVFTFPVIDSAMTSEKPVIVLVQNSKACACTRRKCNQALEMTRKLVQNNPGDYVYSEVDQAENADFSAKFEVKIVPTLIFFNNKGEEIARLRSMQIRKEALLEQIATLTESKTEEGYKKAE